MLNAKYISNKLCWREDRNDLLAIHRNHQLYIEACHYSFSFMRQTERGITPAFKNFKIAIPKKDPLRMEQVHAWRLWIHLDYQLDTVELNNQQAIIDRWCHSTTLFYFLILGFRIFAQKFYSLDSYLYHLLCNNWKDSAGTLLLHFYSTWHKVHYYLVWDLQLNLMGGVHHALSWRGSLPKNWLRHEDNLKT